MPLAIPDLADYGLSVEYGYLPLELPLQALSGAYYREWEMIAISLRGFLVDGRLRDLVNELPTLSTVWLKEEAEWRRVYVLLIFILQAYVWEEKGPWKWVRKAINMY